MPLESNLSLPDIDERKIRLRAIIILFSLILGVWSALSRTTFLMFLMIGIATFFVYRNAAQEERKFIITLFITGLLFRLFVASVYYYFYLLPGNPDNFFAPDGEIYVRNAWYISRGLLNKDLYTVPSTEHVFKSFGLMVDWLGRRQLTVNEYEVGPVSYFLAIVFSIFGYEPLFFRFFNCLLGSLSAVFVYKIAKSLFNRRVAGVAMVLTIFYPSLFIFSLTNLKDPLINFCLILIVWKMTKFSKDGSLSDLAQAVVLILIVSYFRRFLLLILASLLFIYLFFSLIFRSSFVKKIFIFIIVLYIGLNPFVKKELKRGMNSLIVTQRGYAYEVGGATNYKIYPERFYNSESGIGDLTLREFLVSYANGLSYVLFSPFLWDIKTRNQIFCIPQVVLWYFLFGFAVLGMLRTIRYKFFDALGMILYVLILTSALTLSSGNEGNLFRHRDMLSPLYLILCAFGLANLPDSLKNNLREK